ncbi:hypothetical protein HAX54_018465 [Datura stramonium]|uniref:Uncharacterized protein n=1 Tax=Datura stramonium TaxID=4076 RepID=A0ABS8UQ68_DATST|nr:hypothetical protein [Datura stramonium]
MEGEGRGMQLLVKERRLRHVVHCGLSLARSGLRSGVRVGDQRMRLRPGVEGPGLRFDVRVVVEIKVKNGVRSRESGFKSGVGVGINIRSRESCPGSGARLVSGIRDPYRGSKT